MSNTIEDIKDSDVILVTGSNTTENHPVISSHIKRAVKNGTKLIVVDPRKIKLTEFADIWLRPELGTNIAWINGLMNVIINYKLQDDNFIKNRTQEYEKLKKTIEKYTPEYVSKITGIDENDIIKAAKIYANGKASSIMYCMGITQHSTGTDNVKSLANLALLCGNLGIRGGGVNPLRGQNNVQGACDMGALPNVYTGYQPVINEEIKNKMESFWNTKGLSSNIGLTATQMVPAALEGKIKALYIIGENPLVSDPDLNHTKKCFESLDFLVVQDIFLTQTAQIADVVLPSACFAEKDGTFSNTERKVQKIRKAVNPPGKAKTDWQIIQELSCRLGYPMSYENEKEIFEEIAKVTPSYKGISYERIEENGIHWPCPSSDHPGTPILHTKEFPIGKAVFHPAEHKDPAEIADKEYPLKLTTGRLLYHYHTGTMTRKTDGLNEKAPESFVEISEHDAAKYKVNDNSMVKITSRRGEITAKVKISDIAVSGTIFIPFHFAEAAANVLTNAKLDPVSKIPEFKACAVRISNAA